MTTADELRRRLADAVIALPEPELRAVARFLDQLDRNPTPSSDAQPPYRPIALGGLWRGITIRDEDIQEARREMWRGFGERSL